MSAYTLSSKTFSAVSGVHSGTGMVSKSVFAVVPASVGEDVKSQLDVKDLPYSIQVLSLEAATKEAPNWFGVSFRKGISSFNTVNIFCHPHPGHAGMDDSQYPTRSGKWPELFRYAEILGRQMSMAKSNIITVVPFFTNSTYQSTGIIKANWLDLMEQVIGAVKMAAKGASPAAGPNGGAVSEINPLVTTSGIVKDNKMPTPPGIRTSSAVLTHVVLSCFSRGSQLMAQVGAAPGLRNFVREAWVFDGLGGSASSGDRVLTYDHANLSTKMANTFHVPPERWVSFHKRVVTWEQNHGNVPGMMAFHAASISRLGK